MVWRRAISNKTPSFDIKATFLLKKWSSHSEAEYPKQIPASLTLL